MMSITLKPPLIERSLNTDILTTLLVYEMNYIVYFMPIFHASNDIGQQLHVMINSHKNLCGILFISALSKSPRELEQGEVYVLQSSLMIYKSI